MICIVYEFIFYEFMGVIHVLIAALCLINTQTFDDAIDVRCTKDET